MPQVTSDRWADIYRESFPRVYRALVATLFDAEAARDALHEAFLKGLERPPQDINPEGWLYRVALRHAWRGPRFLRALLRDELSSEGEESRILARVEAGMLLRLLTPRQRSIVVAHYYLGFTQIQIAELLQISRGAVGATISKSLARMRKAGANA